MLLQSMFGSLWAFFDYYKNAKALLNLCQLVIRTSLFYGNTDPSLQKCLANFPTKGGDKYELLLKSVADSAFLNHLNKHQSRKSGS